MSDPKCPQCGKTEITHHVCTKDMPEGTAVVTVFCGECGHILATHFQQSGFQWLKKRLKKIESKL